MTKVTLILYLYMHRLYLILFCIIYCVSISCQINEDFSSQDLSIWSGNISNFVVNTDNQLQLNDTEAGNSAIYTISTFPDSIHWSLDVAMAFTPSASNRLSILLAADNSDISIANGYMIEIGENGSDDAIHLIELINGAPAMIASGTLGQVSEAFELTIDITYDADGIWRLRTSEMNSVLNEEEFAVSYFASIDFATLTTFGLYCDYTSTRSDKFFFDNIIVEELQADLTSPVINAVEVINDQQLRLILDEAVDDIVSSVVSNYTITPQTEIDRVEIDPSVPNVINLYTTSSLPSGSTFTLTVSGISDIAGNSITSQSFDLRLLESPDAGDLLINEILFDPYSGGEDFLEIINASDKFINLKELIIRNTDNQDENIITETIELLPNEILAISSDINNIIDTYNPPDTARLYMHDIPAFNNTSGNATLLSRQMGGLDRIIDSYDYDDTQHLSILSDVEGVSLERLSLISDTNNVDNWTSSSEANLFATPGYSNSARINPGSTSDEMISLEHKVFSPNSDGRKDNMILNYKLDKSGYIANVSVYDDQGRIQTYMAENLLLPTQGFLRWNGMDVDNRPAPIGMYIIYYELYHSNGDVIEGKKVCVLAQNLN